MIELFARFEDGEVISLKFARDFLNNVDDADVFEIFSVEHEKRFGKYSPCKYISDKAV